MNVTSSRIHDKDCLQCTYRTILSFKLRLIQNMSVHGKKKSQRLPTACLSNTLEKMIKTIVACQYNTTVTIKGCALLLQTHTFTS